MSPNASRNTECRDVLVRPFLAADLCAGCRAISMVVGTGVGGLLAQPAVHYPSLFSATGLFGRLVFFIGKTPRALVPSVGIFCRFFGQSLFVYVEIRVCCVQPIQ